MNHSATALSIGARLQRSDVRAPFAACHGCTLRGSQLCRMIRDEQLLGTHPPVLRHIARGKRIVEQSGTSGILGVIRRGYARRSIIKLSGKRVLFGLASPGDIVGGLPNWEHDYDFEAATDVEICMYDRTTVKRHMDLKQTFRKALLKEMDERHHRLLDLLWHNGTLNSRERIIGFLVSAAEFMPTEPLPDGSLILKMEIDRSDWADLTNTVVETISRTLRYLEEKKLVTSHTPYRFQIHDLNLLATIAGVEPPTRHVQNGYRSTRKETPFGPLNSNDGMTAINAQMHGANRLNSVMKSVPVQKRGLTRRRLEDDQETVRN